MGASSDEVEDEDKDEKRSFWDENILFMSRESLSSFGLALAG